MDESRTPDPEPSVALVPPGRRPPMALATVPVPEPMHRPLVVPAQPTGWTRLLEGSRALANAVLDATDEVVDRVAEAVGMRPGAR